ncbi:MAG: 30S ribosomal protein S5 [Candidatus Woesearchaeota archaeon]
MNNRRQQKKRNEDKAQIRANQLDTWVPKTDIGKKVFSGELTDLKPLLENGVKIMESQIVDKLLPNLSDDLLLVGQAKGKFGGGQRRAFKQTQKKTKEGNKPSFTTYAAVGNKNGFVGVGMGKSKETVPAREKAIRNAKLNVIYVPRGSGSWQANVIEQNSIPFKVTGKCGSVELTLIPAPKGTGLVIEKECAKILALAGITDIWAKMHGKTKTKINVVKACYDALLQLSKMKVSPAQKKALGIELQKIHTPEEITQEVSE